MRGGKSSKPEKTKPENFSSAIPEKLKGKEMKKGNISTVMRERQYVEDTFKEYPPPPEEQVHELEMEKRLKRLIEEGKSEI